MQLIGDASRWPRGAEYLRMAGRGLPTLKPAFYILIAKANERAGNIEAAWSNFEICKQAGRAVGPKNMAAQDQHDYFAVVKILADDAIGRGNVDAGIENYRIYTEYDRSGIDTYRSLARLYERKQDVWAALHATERGLLYDSRDPELVQLKDKYYYSVTAEELRPRWEQVRTYFDIPYCISK